MDPAVFVWVRPDDTVAIGDELVGLADGATRDEPPWPFLGLQPWSRQRWAPRVAAVAEQGPGRGADRVEGRRWRDLLVVGRHTTDVVRWTDHGVLVEARRLDTGECAWQHQVSGSEETSAWSRWLTVTDDAVMKRPDSRQAHRDLVRYPDPARGGIRWALSWQLGAARTSGGSGEVLVLYDPDQPFVVGVDVDTGVPRWRFAVPDGGVPVAVRATDHHVVVCAFPADLHRHLPYASHGPRPPVELAAPPAMTVTVHDRATGAVLWSHRWSWPEQVGVLASVTAVTVAGAVVAIQEGNLLCARRISDGVLLWSRPVVELSTKPPQIQRRLPVPLSFRGHDRRMAWIWLQDFHGSVGEGTAITADTLIEPRTGRSLGSESVFHVGDGGLLLARRHGTLICTALPW